MAVEAHRLNPIFSSQFFPNREIPNAVETDGQMYATQTRYGAVPLLGSTTATDETAPSYPMYSLAATTTDYLIPQSVKPAIQSVNSSVTCNGESARNNDRLLPVPLSMRKRPRQDSVIVNVTAMPRASSHLQCQEPSNDPIMFLGHDLSENVQQQQLDVDRLISHHIERMRMEIEEKRKAQGKRIMEAIEQGLVRRLRAKDEEMDKIGRLNLLLEEKMKSLCVENQIWRDLAQANEATANALRSNLQQVLAAVERSRYDEPTEEDAESCCGSSGGVEEKEEEGAHDKKRTRRITRRECRNCGEGEACVLVLPCRHLCLCTLCGSSLRSCPICKSPRNASVHVNLSSS